MPTSDMTETIAEECELTVLLGCVGFPSHQYTEGLQTELNPRLHPNLTSLHPDSQRPSRI